MANWMKNLAREAFLAGQARGNADSKAFDNWWTSDSPSAYRVRFAIESEHIRESSNEVPPTPIFHPQIEINDRAGLSVCGTCGIEDGTVRLLSLRWRDLSWKVEHGGGTSVALCKRCREETRNILARETLETAK